MSEVFLAAPAHRPARPPRPGWALWQLGFRPFYLLAALQAALAVPLWALQFSGWLPSLHRQAAMWHAHEMVFGYTVAVVVGFLFTAGRNWSGHPTPTGPALMALAALWVTGRILMLTPWALAAAVVNVAFPLGAAWGLWRALHAGGNRRNYFFVALLLMMALAAAAVHLDWWVAASPSPSTITLPAGLGLPVALDGVLFMIAVMAGRVVPMFSNNGVPGMAARRHTVVEKVALGSMIVLLIADAASLPAAAVSMIATVALMAHTARWVLWQPWKTLHNPLVWVLHAAYLWLPIHLGLRVAAAQGWVPLSLATHALTVGAIGGMTLGMITRTALGHTGRPLQASGLETAAYSAVLLAAVVRVVVPLVHPSGLMGAVVTSSVLWTLAFVLYLVRYTPWLLRPRADGRPG